MYNVHCYTLVFMNENIFGRLKLLHCHQSLYYNMLMKGERVQGFRNPFDIVRSSLLEQVRSMRTNFLQASFSTALNVIEEGISALTQHSLQLKRHTPLWLIVLYLSFSFSSLFEKSNLMILAVLAEHNIHKNV